MRTRILDATVDCLVLYGYAGTTTPRIADMAGVTRGAQVHHFRSKEDLVVAAVEHLAQQRVQTAIHQHGRLLVGADPVPDVLEFLWESHQDKMFVATMELWVAARIDDVLAQHLRRVEPLVNETLVAAVAQILPGELERKDVRNVIYTAMDALRGILVVSFVDRDMAEARKRWDRACTFLNAMLSAALSVPPTS